MQIPLHSNPLDIDSSRIQVGVIERVLGRMDRASFLCHDAPEGVPRLMKMHMLQPGFFPVQFQVADEGV